MTGRGSPARGTPETGGGPSAGSRGGPVPAGMRILAIDDSPSARKVFQGVLMRLGIELPDLRFAGDAPEALQVFTQWHPDVVFVDIELKSRSPGLLPKTGTASHVPSSPPTDTVDGDTLTHQLLERNPRLHVVIVTACRPRPSSRRRALLARGAMDVIDEAGFLAKTGPRGSRTDRPVGARKRADTGNGSEPPRRMSRAQIPARPRVTLSVQPFQSTRTQLLLVSPPRSAIGLVAIRPEAGSSGRGPGHSDQVMARPH